MAQFTLERYFSRIGYHGVARPGLETVAGMMRCQLCSVPFENLDIQAGRIISLAPDDIVEKIVERRRGGYCFEVNGLFAMALDALQIPYFFIAARPLTHQGIRRPKTHMAIIVRLDGEQWLCDCGYGGYGIRAPMCLDALDGEVNQDGEIFMLSRLNEHELVLQTRVHDVWEAQYAFDLAEQSWVDFAPAHHYNSTHPDSLFFRKLLVVLCTATGRKILFGNSLKISADGHHEKHHVSAENRAVILRDEFDLIQ